MHWWLQGSTSWKALWSNLKMNMLCIQWKPLKNRTKAILIFKDRKDTHISISSSWFWSRIKMLKLVKWKCVGICLATYRSTLALRDTNIFKRWPFWSQKIRVVYLWPQSAWLRIFLKQLWAAWGRRGDSKCVELSRMERFQLRLSTGRGSCWEQVRGQKTQQLDPITQFIHCHL